MRVKRVHSRRALMWLSFGAQRVRAVDRARREWDADLRGLPHSFPRRIMMSATFPRMLLRCAVLAAAAAAPLASAAELNDPPVRFESQDVQGWAKPVIPK